MHCSGLCHSTPSCSPLHFPLHTPVHSTPLSQRVYLLGFSFTVSLKQRKFTVFFSATSTFLPHLIHLYSCAWVCTSNNYIFVQHQKKRKKKNNNAPGFSCFCCFSNAHTLFSTITTTIFYCHCVHKWKNMGLCVHCSWYCTLPSSPIATKTTIIIILLCRVVFLYIITSLLSHHDTLWFSLGLSANTLFSRKMILAPLPFFSQPPHHHTQSRLDCYYAIIMIYLLFRIFYLSPFFLLYLAFNHSSWWSAHATLFLE